MSNDLKKLQKIHPEKSCALFVHSVTTAANPDFGAEKRSASHQYDRLSV